MMWPASWSGGILAAAVLLSLSPTSAFVTRSRTQSSRRQSFPMEAKSILDLDNSNRSEILAEDGGTVLIDAYATFCGPCKLIEPVIERCAANMDDVTFVKYNVEDKNAKQVKFDLLTQKVVIRKLPTLLLCQNGKVLGTHSGLISYEELDSFIADALRANGENDIHEEESSATSRGKISFGSSLERDDYALGL